MMVRTQDKKNIAYKNCGEDASRQKKGIQEKKIVVRTHLAKKKRDKKKNCGEDTVRQKKTL